MAEHESLDLTFGHARRGNMVRDAAQKGGSCRQVAALTRKTSLGVLRKGLREFEGYGVTTADFYADRESPDALIALLARNRDEWLAIAAEGRRKGLLWARLLDPSRSPVGQGLSHAPA